MKKILTLVQACITLIVGILLFNENALIWRYYYPGQSINETTQDLHNLMTVQTSNTFHTVIYYIFLISLVLSLGYFLIAIFTNHKIAKHKATLAIPCVATVLSIVCLLLANSFYQKLNDGMIISVNLDVLAYIIIVLNVIVVLLELYKRFACKDKPVAFMRHNYSSVQHNTYDADELKKYKELLDSGAISQEEYDAKKAQLLDL